MEQNISILCFNFALEWRITMEQEMKCFYLLIFPHPKNNNKKSFICNFSGCGGRVVVWERLEGSFCCLHSITKSISLNIKWVIHHAKQTKSGVALTQLSLTLHYSRRIFYYQYYIHIQSLFYMLCSWRIAFIIIIIIIIFSTEFPAFCLGAAAFI